MSEEAATYNANPAPPPSTAMAPAQRQDLSHVNLLKASPFEASDSFDLAWRMAGALASSGNVPDAYRTHTLRKRKERGEWVESWEENPQARSNCLIAIELGCRLKMSPLMIMQNVDMIKGRPGYRGTFLIALINSARDDAGGLLFTRLRFEFEGTIGKPGSRCRAWNTERATGDKLVGAWITWEMVIAEDWLSKDGSKWKTMPELMFTYRAASFFSRQFCPDVTLGLHESDELRTIVDAEFTRVEPTYPGPERARSMNRQLDDADAAAEAAAKHGDAGTESGPSPQQRSEPQHDDAREAEKAEPKPRQRRARVRQAEPAGEPTGEAEKGADDAGRGDQQAGIEQLNRELAERDHAKANDAKAEAGVALADRASATPLPSDDGAFNVE